MKYDQWSAARGVSTYKRRRISTEQSLNTSCMITYLWVYLRQVLPIDTPRRAVRKKLSMLATVCAFLTSFFRTYLKCDYNRREYLIDGCTVGSGMIWFKIIVFNVRYIYIIYLHSSSEVSLLPCMHSHVL